MREKDLKPKPPSVNPASHPESLGEEGDDFRRTGRVTFDERGNAAWEWALGNGDFTSEITSTRLKKLEDPSLSIAEDGPAPAVRINSHGAKKGYHPYDSGHLAKHGTSNRKKDLRRLSEWLKLKKQHESLSRSNDSEED